jgi:Holliday junction resolvase RusA-like endonuclease
MKIEIENYKCPSWNEFNRRVHWAVRACARDELKMLVYVEMMRYRGLKIDNSVNITIEAHFKSGMRRDLDNLFVKPILDGIVQSGLIRDDNGDVVETLILKAKVKMPSNKIIIYIN